MTTPEATTAVTAPAPAPAPTAAPATVEHISALHRHLEELKSWVGEKFKEVVALVGKAVPVVEKVGPVVAAAIPGAGAIVAGVEKAVEVAAQIAGCCSHAVADHTQAGCTATDCKCTLTTAGARTGVLAKAP